MFFTSPLQYLYFFTLYALSQGKELKRKQSHFKKVPIYLRLSAITKSMSPVVKNKKITALTRKAKRC